MNSSKFSYIKKFFEQLSSFQAVLILFFVGLISYYNAIFHPFVHDDIVFIALNPFLDDLNLKNIFYQTSFFYNEDFPLVNAYYRPFLELFNRLVNVFFNRNPHGFHLINIIIHILNSVLVYYFVKICCRCKNRLSLFAALVFLVHPIQTEAVACISGISNLLCVFLCLISFFLYVKATNQRDLKRTSFFLASLSVFFLALLTKEQSAIVPILIFLYEIFIRRKEKEVVIKRVLPIGIFFIVLVLYFLLRKFLFGSMVSATFDTSGELLLRIKTIPRTLVMYFGLIVFPRNLHYYRSINILDSNFLGTIAFIVVAMCSIWFIRRTDKNKRRIIYFGLAWVFASLLPVLNIIPIINEYSLILTAEHFLYFPMIGMVLIMATACSSPQEWMQKKGMERLFLIGGTILVVLFMGLTIRQNKTWQNEVTLYKRTLKYEKDFGRVRILLGRAYFQEKEYELAIEEFQKGLVIMQGYLKKVRQVEEIRNFYLVFIKKLHEHIIHTARTMKNYELAVEHSQQLIELEPEASRLYYNLATDYIILQDYNMAIKNLHKAIENDSEFYMAMNSLAICYTQMGNYGNAEEWYRKVVEKDPNSESAKENLKNFLLMRKSK